MDLMKFRKMAFDQSWILNQKRSEGVDLGRAGEGICQELCWKWLKRFHQKSTLYPTPLARLTALFKERTINKAIERHNSATYADYIEEKYKISRYEVFHRQGYSETEMNAFRLHGGGVFFSFICPRYRTERDPNPKHAIAFYMLPRPPGSRLLNPLVYVFDPNFGEFEMKFGEFSMWLRLFLQEKYGATLENVAETNRWKAN